MPHTEAKVTSWEVDSYGFIHQNYFLFQHGIRLSPYLMLEFPRFNGFFLKPGHIGTITSLFLYANGFDLKKKRNVVYLVVIAASLSAAAYTLTVMSFLLYKFSGKFSKMILPVIGCAIGLLLVMNYNNGENAVNELILGKLTYESGAIDGRFSYKTHQLWQKWLDNGDIWLGGLAIGGSSAICWI